MNLERFGSAANPLRPSSLDALVSCRLRSVLLMLGECSDTSGAAADTGSLTHLGVAAYHLEESVQAGLDAMSSGLSRFPKADPDDARLFYTAYTTDPRNAHKAAGVIAIEQKVRCVLPAHELDPTGEDIVIEGTLDQIRRDPFGVKRVWDLKTGKKDAYGYMAEYAMQQAAYVLGAVQSIDESIQPGGLIVAYGWRRKGVDPKTSPGGVFWNYTHSADDCLLILDDVRLAVALIRRGDVAPGPGPLCSYCPAGGLSNCLPMLKKML